MECKIVGTRNKENNYLIGLIVERAELVVDGTLVDGVVKIGDGYKCLLGIGHFYMHPDDLEEIDATS